MNAQTGHIHPLCCTCIHSFHPLYAMMYSKRPPSSPKDSVGYPSKKDFSPPARTRHRESNFASLSYLNRLAVPPPRTPPLLCDRPDEIFGIRDLLSELLRPFFGIDSTPPRLSVRSGEIALLSQQKRRYLPCHEEKSKQRWLNKQR
ncbi:hypothetical protein BJX96DRAFT_79048 [Aspergillus floccosus]